MSAVLTPLCPPCGVRRTDQRGSIGIPHHTWGCVVPRWGMPPPGLKCRFPRSGSKHEEMAKWSYSLTLTRNCRSRMPLRDCTRRTGGDSSWRQSLTHVSQVPLKV